MTDKNLVRNAGIRKAIIVDDGYDETPHIEELADVAAWDTLFDDAIEENELALKRVYPSFDIASREELKVDQKFVDALWELRGNLGDIVSELFMDYEQKTRENAPFLEAAERALDDLDINYETLGRNFVEAAETADLIVIDLFLGTKQGQPDFDLTVRKLRDAMENRKGPPPSVILMSQVASVADRSKIFRRKVGLHASGFRWINKNDIGEPGRIRSLIVTLATHRKDSHALAVFLETWKSGAKQAVERAAVDLLRVDIDDLQHTKSLLLNVEGLNTSSYMLDVFDRVLQYEIESDVDVLRAARGLDTIGEDPPPLTIATDRDTFLLLDKTIFVNPKRMNQPTGAVWPITFGDIIVPRHDTKIKRHGLFAGCENRVFFVASPECDMIRTDGLRTALLISGVLHRLEMNACILDARRNVTPILSMRENLRFQIEWDFGSLKTISLMQARNLLGPKGDGEVAARLRDVSALSLRQKFLNNLGRVGEMISPLKSFPFVAEVFLPMKNGELYKVDLPRGEILNGTCLVRRENKKADLVFDQNKEDDFTEALHTISRTLLHPLSLKYFEQGFVRQLFRTGLQECKFPLVDQSPAKLFSLDPVPNEPTKREKIGTIITTLDVSVMHKSKLKSAGFIFHFISME